MLELSNEQKKLRTSSEKMKHYCREHKIFMDTCSLLHYASELFWENVIPLLEQCQNKIIVPYRCIEELRKHSQNEENEALAVNAKGCIDKLGKLVELGYVEIRGEASDNFADNVFQVVFTKFRLKYKLLLITQDGNLAKDILALNEIKSVKANSVTVQRINKYGFLSGFVLENNENEKIKEQEKTEEIQGDKIKEDEAFRLCTEITMTEDSKLSVSVIPTEGDYVYTETDKIKLGEQLGGGGEATVYLTDTSYVAKIYKKEKITTRKYEKLRVMLTRNLEYEGICFPVALLYNEKREFVGCLMPQAKGQELQKSVFGPKPLFLKKLPGWAKEDTVRLCITILKMMRYLHKRNIIIGDINPANILVESPKKVYFVDTDSYQIEEFPCPVGTINYTAPEIQRKSFSDFLRTMGNENFAVATLLFMIMLPGKPPYSQQGGEDQISNIIKMDFSYPLGDSSNGKTPDGPWRFIWSHLTYDIKDAFYNTFRKEGEYATEDSRLSSEEWLLKFKHYYRLLKNGLLAEQDEMSGELFPTRYKKNPKSIYIRCSLCEKEAEEIRCKNGICPECLKDGEIYKCSKCGKEMIFTNYTKYIIGKKKRSICPDCFELTNEVRMRELCVECGRLFEITNGQYDYFLQKGYELPKRCEVCRGKQREIPSRPLYDFSNTRRSASEKVVPDMRPPKKEMSGVEADRTDNDSTASSASGSPCFITTAVCEYYGKADDCEELTKLRKYRDTWLAQEEGGKELIEEYYECAPEIVNRIKRSTDYAEYCETLMNTYISECIKMIDKGDFVNCKNKYIEMVSYAKTLK